MAKRSRARSRPYPCPRTADGRRPDYQLDYARESTLLLWRLASTCKFSLPVLPHGTNRTIWSWPTLVPRALQYFPCRVMQVTPPAHAETWIGQLENEFFRSVTFINAQSGWALGNSDADMGDTVDAGATWTEPGVQAHPVTPDSLAFTDLRNGWAVGSGMILSHFGWRLVLKLQDFQPPALPKRHRWRVLCECARDGWVTISLAGDHPVHRQRARSHMDIVNRTRILSSYGSISSVTFVDSRHGCVVGVDDSELVGLIRATLGFCTDGWR